MSIAKTNDAFVVWITGLPAAGKSTVAARLARRLGERGVQTTLLESDVLRRMFSPAPAYDDRDRDYFYRSLAFIGAVLAEHGIPVIVDATAHRRVWRESARRRIPQFIEVFVDCPLEVCIQRDPKGIYRMASEGKAAHVPGVQAVYEPPERPDIVIRGDQENPEQAAQRIVELLIHRGFLRS
jgi:adenylylsulfate kinase